MEVIALCMGLHVEWTTSCVESSLVNHRFLCMQWQLNMEENV
jgi:hypothetical protein